jgi:hypothetical protein
MLPDFEICFNQISKCQKIPTKNLMRRSRHLCSHKVVSRENDTFCVVYKKTSFGAKIGVCMRHIFVFLHKTQKILVFHETWHMHIECRDLRAIFLFGIF